jgi:hypothetical protein
MRRSITSTGTSSWLVGLFFGMDVSLLKGTASGLAGSSPYPTTRQA